MAEKDGKIEVEFGAKTSGLEAGAEKSASLISRFRDTAKGAADGVKSSWAGLGPVFAGVAQATGLHLAGEGAAHLGTFGRIASEVAGSVSDKWDALPALFQRVVSGMVAATLAIGAGLLAKKIADGNAEMVESTRDFARALGTTTNEASVYRAALDDIGSSQGEFQGLAKGLSRQLKENEGDIKAMGLSTRDASGNLRPLNELTLDAIEVLKTYREGTDRAIAGQQLFGRGMDSSSRLMLLNKETIEQNRLAVEELGLAVGESSVKAFEDYDAASDRASLSLKGIGKAIGESVLPVATELTEWFNAVAPTAITVIRGALGGLATTFLVVTNGVRVLWETLNALVITLTEPLRAFAEGLYRILTGDFEGAFNTFKQIGPTIAGAWETAMTKMEDSSQKTSERIKSIWAFATGGNDAAGESGAVAGSKGAKTKGDKEKKGAEEKEPSFMAYYQNMLSEEKQVQAALTQGQEFTKQQELDFWRFLLDNATLTSKDKVAVLKRVADLDVSIAAESRKRKEDLQRTELDGAEQFAQAKLSVEEAAAQAALSTGQITNEQMIALQEGFEIQRYEIQANAIRERLRILDQDPEASPAAAQALKNQLLIIEQQFQAKVIQLRSQAQIAAQAASPWNGWMTQLNTGFNTLITSLIQKTFTWRGAFQYVLQNLGQSFASVAADMATIWAKNMLKIQLSSKETSLMQIHEHAKSAAAGAYDAVVGIPYVGPFLAPAAAAVAYAGTMAFASAENGYDIPAGVNPLVQTHAREMILPAKYADVIRGMEEGGGSGKGGDTFIMHLQALDGQSVKRVLMNNPDAVAAGMKSARQNFSIRKGG